MNRDLSRLLRPRSIAIFGSGWAENVIDQCDKVGFAGDVWPVHPTRDAIGSKPCFRSIRDLPSAPDAAFVGINRLATVDIINQLSSAGSGGAICFASGWAETGDNDLQAALVNAAGGMPILGPNCYGLLNMLDGAVIWPDQHGGQRCETGVAILSQSSNIAINLTMQRRGLPIAYVACLGNAAQTGMNDLAQEMLSDDRVTALGIYAEGFEDPVGLAELAHKARAQGKGVVVLKSGRSEAGAAAALSHTAAMSGTHAASQSFLRQAGIASVGTLSELVETLKILHIHGPLRGTQVCAVACSGGEAGLTSDLAEAVDLAFPPLSNDQKNALHQVLGPLVTLSNPLDYHTFIWGDLARTTTVFAETLRPFDAGLFVIDPPRSDICDPTSFEPALEAIAAAQTATGKPAFAVAALPENIDEDRARAMLAEGIVALNGLETALVAIAAASVGDRSGWVPWAREPDRETSLLDEAKGKKLLSCWGVMVPNGVTAGSLTELAARAADLHGPLALKGLGFAHKTEAGAVRLGIADLTTEPDIPGASGYLAEEMITDVIAEMIIGLRRDPVYGATLLLGFGGIEAELLGDTQTLVLPVSEGDIHAAIRRLKLSPLLYGYRGRPPADTDAIIRTVMSLQSTLASEPEIAEIEINPLMVRETGAVAVDALIRRDI